MKKITCLIIISLFVIYNNQTYSQIENGSFEQWDTFPFLNPTGWSTFNVFNVSVSQSTDAQHGSLSAKMEITEFAGERLEPILQNIGFQNFLNSRVNQVNFYYKSDFKNFAKLEVYISTWDSNGTNQQLLPSGSGETTIKTSTTGWTLVQLPIEYFSLENIPAYINVAFAVTDSAESTDLSSMGSYALIDNVSLDQPTDVQKTTDLPAQFKLSQNYPNPFNPATKIEYSIADPSFVNLAIFDILGNKVAELVNEDQRAGNYRYNFNGANLASGTYLIQLKAGNYVESKKMILMK